jgi:hypothetical protein
MAAIQPPPTAKLFVAVLYRDPAYRDAAAAEFVQRWGPIDHEGGDHLFDVTDYYEPEMGRPLYRRLFAFENLIVPSGIVEIKLACNEIEDRLRVDAQRTVNCDAGFLDPHKIVLASAKEAGQKIYLDKGIYADLAARFKSGAYQPFEWSFPDFKDGRYNEDLLRIRGLFRAQTKAGRRLSSDHTLQ